MSKVILYFIVIIRVAPTRWGGGELQTREVLKTQVYTGPTIPTKQAIRIIKIATSARFRIACRQERTMIIKHVINTHRKSEPYILILKVVAR